MIDGHSTFLNKFKSYYPEVYLKIIEFPDSYVVGLINEISNYKDMIALKDPKKILEVKEYLEWKISMYSEMLQKPKQ